MIKHSRVGSKGQTVIPSRVRKRLGLKPVDLIRYRLSGDTVVVERAGWKDKAPFATFTEWASDADNEAYGTL